MDQPVTFRTRYIAAYVLILCLLANAQTDRLDGAVSDAEGVRTVSFEMPEGRINLYLPDDMAAGDTISGTVSLEPKGKTQEEKARSQDVLNGMVLEFSGTAVDDAGQVALGRRKDITINLRQAISAAAQELGITLKRPGGVAAVGLAAVKLSQVPQTQPTNYTLPSIGQAGRPVTIVGPFGSTAGSATAAIGGQPAGLIAASPRKAIFRSPMSVEGPSQMILDHGGSQVTGQFRNVSVKLSAPSTNLKRGQRTNVHMEIKGLKGESQAVPFRLVTTGTASMQGGNVQDILILPGQISQDGTFVKDFALTGTSTGTFSVTATVTNPTPVAGNESKCDCKCELSNPPIVTAGVQQVKGGTEHSFEPNIKNASCNGNRCEVSKTEYSWSVGAGSTATYTIVGNNSTSKKFTVKVTKGGTVDLTVTVTVTCSDGTTCSATGNKTFRVKA